MVDRGDDTALQLLLLAGQGAAAASATGRCSGYGMLQQLLLAPLHRMHGGQGGDAGQFGVTEHCNWYFRSCCLIMLLGERTEGVTSGSIQTIDSTFNLSIS